MSALPARTRNILFLCTGNSARSIMAECLMNRLGRGHWRAFSAGSHPAGEVHPLALELLRQNGHDTTHLSSKNWQLYARPGAPVMDAIITVCNNAAGETCPVWPGRPATDHWDIPDPAAATGPRDVRQAAFENAYAMLEDRIRNFLNKQR